MTKDELNEIKYLAEIARDGIRELVDMKRIDGRTVQNTLFLLEEQIWMMENRLQDLEDADGLKQTLTREALAAASARTLAQEDAAGWMEDNTERVRRRTELEQAGSEWAEQRGIDRNGWTGIEK